MLVSCDCSTQLASAGQISVTCALSCCSDVNCTLFSASDACYMPIYVLNATTMSVVATVRRSINVFARLYLVFDSKTAPPARTASASHKPLIHSHCCQRAPTPCALTLLHTTPPARTSRKRESSPYQRLAQTFVCRLSVTFNQNCSQSGGASACQACAPNTVPNANNASCTACPPGLKAMAMVSIINVPNSGHDALNPALGCQPCPPYFFSPGNGQSCLPCGNGTTPSADGSSCDLHSCVFQQQIVASTLRVYNLSTSA